VKKYEGLFILNSTGEEEIKTAIDRISQAIGTAGGKIETVQKMEKRPFTRIADKKYTSGFYVNIIFEIEPAGMKPLRDKFVNDEEVFRIMFTAAPPVTTPAAA
jgi:ribosomal protein S6